MWPSGTFLGKILWQSLTTPTVAGICLLSNVVASSPSFTRVVNGLKKLIRGLSLLNVDYKIASRAIALRLLKVIGPL